MSPVPADVIPIMTPRFNDPFSANIFLTHYCNLSCSFCCYRPFQSGKNRDLTTEEWFKIFEELAELKIFQIRIPGGEPFCRPDILSCLEHIASCRMRFTLNTNGTLVSERQADFIAELNRADEIQISVDGLEKSHDQIRGSGNWRKAVNAVRLFKSRSVPVKVNMVITNSNYADCREASRFFLEELGVDTLRISSVSDAFETEPNGNEKVSDEIYIRLMREVLELKQKYSNITSSFLDMHRFITHPNDAPGCRTCSMLDRSVTIRADGAIIACINSDDIVLGQCGKDKIRDVWQNSQQLNELRTAIRAGRQLDEACAGCEYSWYCRQYCPARKREGVSRCIKKLAKLYREL